MHWVNALAIFVMIGSGWRIYDYYPALPIDFGFPYNLTLGGDITLTEVINNEYGLANALAWHFAAMWVLVMNFAAYLIVGAASGHFRRDFLPISAVAFARDFLAALRGRLGHRLGEYNAVQKVFYWGCAGRHSGDHPVGPEHLEAGAVAGIDLAVRRLRIRSRRALLRDAGDCRLPDRTFSPGLIGAEDFGRDRFRPRFGITSRGERRPAMTRAVLEPKPLTAGIERRLFLRQTLSLGALTLLTGCDISDQDQVQAVLKAMSRWNDRAQAFLFRRQALAPTYAESDVVRDFRYNAYFPASQAPKLAAADYRLELSGLIERKRPWSVEDLYALPQESQITRHVCVEGWSMIGKWAGPRLGDFLQRVGADLTAKYVGFRCADGYYGSIDMATALHPQTIMAVKFADEILPVKFGYPFKVRIPTKLGFKNPKWVTTIFVTNRMPGGFWEDRGYNWYSGS